MASEHEPTLEELLGRMWSTEWETEKHYALAAEARTAIIDRDRRLTAERDAAIADRDSALNRCNDWANECMVHSGKCVALRAERDAAIAERDVARAEQLRRAAKYGAERDQAIAERDYRESLVREEAYARGRADALEGINGTRLS